MAISANLNHQKTQPQSQGQQTPQTATQAQKGNHPASGGSLELPMSLCQNIEELDNRHIYQVCRIDPKVQDLCTMCDKPSNPVFRCKSCQAAQYCSWECNVDDAQQHALVCSQWSDFSTPPCETTARILVFPAQSTNPVFAWAELKHVEGESSPRLVLQHPEFLTFAKLLYPGRIETVNQVVQIGCINECRALAATKPKVVSKYLPQPFWTSPLGHGLFVLEWLPPSSVNLGMDWINQSVQNIISLPPTPMKPGHTWLWTGPLAIFSLDVSQTHAKSHHFTLDHVTMRDVRHAIDFLSLNLRNPALPTAPSPTPGELVKTARFPYPIAPAIKINEIHTPVAMKMCITNILEQVHISRELPRSNRVYEGVSVLAAALGLAWVVRTTLCHGEELDWLYKGFYTNPPPPAKKAAGTKTSPTTTKKTTGTETDKGKTSPPVLPAVLHRVYTTPSPTTDTSHLTHTHLQTTLPRSGDGLTLLSAGGTPLLKEHIHALLEFISHHRIQPDDRRVVKPEHFDKFWRHFKAREGLATDVPSPYEVRPLLCEVLPGDHFAVCTETFRFLLRGMRDLKMYEDGSCTYEVKMQGRVIGRRR